jgi:hypothetical protein
VEHSTQEQNNAKQKEFCITPIKKYSQFFNGFNLITAAQCPEILSGHFLLHKSSKKYSQLIGFYFFAKGKKPYFCNPNKGTLLLSSVG